MTMTSSEAKHTIDILSNKDNRKKEHSDTQRKLQLGVLKDNNAFAKYFDSNTRQFDIDHTDLADTKKNAALLDAMIEWEYADRDIQEIEREFQVTLNWLTQFGSEYYYTGMDASGMYTHEIQWSKLEDVARSVAKPSTLFANETEESMANRGL